LFSQSHHRPMQLPPNSFSHSPLRATLAMLPSLGPPLYLLSALFDPCHHSFGVAATACRATAPSSSPSVRRTSSTL
jgi:hypothetical protein